MAVAKSIREALDMVHESFVDAEVIAKAMDLIAGDEGHAYAALFDRQVSRLRNTQQVLEVLLRQKALPLLEDFDRTST